MAMFFFTFLLVPLLGFLIASLTATQKKKKTATTMTCGARNDPPLPPGPKPWPVIGNLPEIRRNKPVFRWIHSLMKELNTEIACIRLANTHVIPVTSPRIAREFLKKQDSVFASRPLTMGTEYCSRGYLTIAVVPQGEQWKKMRKMVASHVINAKTLQWTHEKRIEEADNLTRFINNKCVRNSRDCSALIDLRLVTRQYSGNVARKILFGVRHFGKGTEDGAGPGFEEIEHIESLFTVLTHLYSFILSDYVPWLRTFDLDGHEKIVRRGMEDVSKYNDPFVDERLRQWRHGERTEAQDLLDMFIMAKDSDGKPALTDDEIKAQVTELMLATVDNPSNATEWAMAEMINEPEIMRKAAEEIDRVVGKDRLVLESDIPNLTYVKACAREAFRLHPVAPFNLPHVSNADTVVDGYFIPKGSHVLLSRVGLGRNPSVWDNPLRFEPGRHLRNGNTSVELNEPDLNFLSFSTGRRGCMGVSLGSVMTIMLLARLVQGFSWTVPGGGEGKIDISESEGDLFLAKPLHAVATPRLAPEVYSRVI
ncbi:PREDICTED: phenylalanine N-monooxygenase [Tarenaya hassleriana]|uniref:phenylalanine N-monooxygenase n=1 Tax=Tarenaya hassleriana TaxID=28532 RepID=UPI00053C4AC0|nr:PREDICTED: phenylalanine N-monooxygenase [Tarenaya hassleriana]